MDFTWRTEKHSDTEQVNYPGLGATSTDGEIWSSKYSRNQTMTQITIENLTPHTRYAISVRACTSNTRCGPYSLEFHVQTLEDGTIYDRSA